MSCQVLLVEDDGDIRDTFAQVLELSGHVVTTAATGREALARVENDGPFGLILLDLWLPDLNGWAFRERQLEEDLQADTPVVIVSGVAENLRSEAAAIGAVEAISKPVEPDRLLQAVEEHCVAI